MKARSDAEPPREVKPRVLLAATLVWAGLIAGLALAPRVSYDNFALNHGTIAHILAYSLLAALLCRLLTLAGRRRAAGLSFIISGGFGVLVEYGQHLMPPRTFDPGDIIMNFAAAALGAGLAWWFSR